MELGLAGTAFVVTGASCGLGLAGAQALSDEGARVVLRARTLSGWPPRRAGRGVTADLAAPEAPTRLVGAAL